MKVGFESRFDYLRVGASLGVLGSAFHEVWAEKALSTRTLASLDMRAFVFGFGTVSVL